MTSSNKKPGRNNLKLWGCVSLMLFLSACGSSTPPDTRATDESAIRDLDAQWSKAAGAKDLDGAVSYYSDDASMLPPNAAIATSNQAIRAAWVPLLAPGSTVSWQTSKVEVARSGDLAYTIGVYQATEKDASGKTEQDHGKYVEVWKKQADGKWKTVADIFNSDVPAAAPSPKKTKAKARSRRSRTTRRASRRATS